MLGEEEIAIERAREHSLGAAVCRNCGHIGRVVICPHGPDDACGCRKPRPGMLEQLARHFDTPLAGVPVIAGAGTNSTAKSVTLSKLAAECGLVAAESAEDLEEFRGQLAGKIVFLGELEEVEPAEKPLFRRRGEDDMAETMVFDIPEGGPSKWMKRFREPIAEDADLPAAVLLPKPV